MEKRENKNIVKTILDTTKVEVASNDSVPELDFGLGQESIAEPERPEQELFQEFGNQFQPSITDQQTQANIKSPYRSRSVQVRLDNIKCRSIS